MTNPQVQELAEKVRECFRNVPPSVDINCTVITYQDEIVKCALEAAHELGRTQGPQWIDVREEMPEPGVTVLAIATGSSEVRFLKLFYDGEGAGECGCAEGHEIHGEYWWHEAHSEDLAEDLYLDTGFHSVTHWMPLPKPPVG